jgi:TonB family protein
MLKKTPIENITLSFTCNKDWNGMQPCTSGRHCASCNKTVFDFTAKGIAELHETMAKEGNVCGRFSQSQLLRATGNQWFSFKRIAASVLITLGFTTFSEEIKAQSVSTANRNQDNVQSQSIVFGMIQETHPVYKHGGDQGMSDFIRKNLRQPSNENIYGLVAISFIIDTTGSVTEPKILKGLSEKADEEALRVVKLLEFYPSILDGKKVPVRYTLPIRFNDGIRKEE